MEANMEESEGRIEEGCGIEKTGFLRTERITKPYV